MLISKKRHERELYKATRRAEANGFLGALHALSRLYGTDTKQVCRLLRNGRPSALTLRDHLRHLDGRMSGNSPLADALDEHDERDRSVVLANGIRRYLDWWEEEGRLDEEWWSAIQKEHDEIRDEWKRAEWQAQLSGKASWAWMDVAGPRIGQAHEEWKRQARAESWDEATRMRNAQEALRRVGDEIRQALEARLRT